ncbi:MAG: hypothetical protein HQK83_04825 [Fibrobacteria bacterium]|nr:hypothetical protein [Fibrobacteria bacterium]
MYIINPFTIESQNIDDDNLPDSRGNNNKTLDPLEIIEYTPRLQNKSIMTITEVTALLLSKSSEITISDSNKLWNYGDFEPEESGLPDWDYVLSVNKTSSAKFDLFITGKVNGKKQKWILPFSLPVNNIAPVLTNPGIDTIKDNQALSFTLSATDQNNDSLSYSMPNFPTGATLTGNQFSWTPNYNQVGQQNITFVVTDNGFPQLSDTLSFVITVIIANRKPVLLNPGNLKGNGGKLISFTLSASDSNGDELTYSMTTFPTGATLTDSQFTWIPGHDQGGLHNVTFTVTDDGNPQLSDTANLNISVITLIDDRDGKIYKTTTIGEQTWMAENLAYLPKVDSVHIGSETITGKYYYVVQYAPYGATEAEEITHAKETLNFSSYGVLYNWDATIDGGAFSSSNPSGVQGVCPTGWHLPGDDEWKQLEMFLGMSQAAADGEDWRGTTEGTKLKEDGTDDYGFSVTYPGYRRESETYELGTIYFEGMMSFYWTVTLSPNTLYVWGRSFSSSNENISRDRTQHNGGTAISIRCLMN